MAEIRGGVTNSRSIGRGASTDPHNNRVFIEVALLALSDFFSGQ